MSLARLLLQTLLYHWRTNLAVLLGVIAGTAVIAGALVVGDSVRGSLREMTLARLGKVDHVLQSPRFVREELASDIAALDRFRSRFGEIAPAIILPASLEKPAASGTKAASRAGGVTLYGVESRAWSLLDHGHETVPLEEELVLSAGVARQLEVRAGDTVNVLVELPSDVPRDALLGKRDETSVQIPLTVRTVLPEESHVARFGLYPDQQLPRTAFVALATLQDRLGLAARRASRRDRTLLPARINALLVSAKEIDDASGSQAANASTELTSILSRAWRPDDLHLRVERYEKPGYLSVESERMILERAVSSAALAGATRLNARVSPVLVYIANEIRVVGSADGAPVDPTETALSRYSVVAGLSPDVFSSPESAPLGPFVLEAGEPPVGTDRSADSSGAMDEVLLNDWLATDLGAHVGDLVSMTWHEVGSHGELPETQRRFKVSGIVKLSGTPADDRGLTPEVRGITDVNSLDEWDAPFPMKKVTARDDEYWKEHRATPKAFVTLPTAQHLWKNRYGDLTSFRLAPREGTSLDELERQFVDGLMHDLQPTSLGLTFRPVKFEGLKAASGTTDFGGLFIGFSFFLILSATILVGLLFRLGIERRAANVGLWLAVGYSQKRIRGLLLSEGLMIVAAGALLGIGAAVAYAAVIIHGLKTWWIGAIGTRFLDLYVQPVSLVIGASISGIVALLAIWWGIRGLWKVSPRALLSGVTQPATRPEDRQHRRRRAGQITVALAGFVCLATVLVVLRVVPEREAFAGFNWPTVVFFVVGMTALATGITALAAWLEADRGTAVRGRGTTALAKLGLRNASRHRSRTLLSTSLIATATFLIVAIAAGHRNPAVERPDKSSGNGGFTLVAESSVPVLYDLNSAAGREKLDLPLPDSGGPLDAVSQVIGFRVNPGENASCLNIYQTTQPTILGVPQEMLDRGGFKFVGAGRENPWALLKEEADDGTIPVFGDMNTLQYSLHVGPGAILEIRDEFQRPVKIRIAGMLDSSIFQGVLLMDEAHFAALFPSRVGSRYFLIDVPPEQSQQVTEVLESNLPGFDAERVVDRLASFLAVQNTYLSTFQALGGLGLLLGTIGLATVMLRNILERRAELAVFRAVGFRDASLAWLVLAESACLLLWGLACGTASALLAMLPHLLSTGADVPWGEVTIILAIVLAIGLIASLAAVFGAVRTPIVATLRAE